MRLNLIALENWHPYPTASERAPWEALPERVRSTLLNRGKSSLKYDWPPLPATLFLDFVRTGNRRNFERPRRKRRDMLANMVLAECVQGQGKFIDQIVNGIWAICEETYWGVPAHLKMQKAGSGLPDVSEPTVDLFAGETASLLAWTAYLLGPQLDKVSPLILKRMQRELEYRILTPCLQRDDFWWMGFRSDHINNWNPWCNSNWLTATLLMEPVESERLAAVEKSMRSLDKFIGIYHPDGGCDEGPGYWTRAAASLFDCLELLYSATNHAVDIYSESLIQEMGRYIYRAHIYDSYFINFADASAVEIPNGDLIHRYGRRIGDERLVGFGAFFADKQKASVGHVAGSIGRQLPAIFNDVELSAAEPSQPLVRDVWLDGVQVMAARSKGGTGKGFYVAAKGGHNAESHNHNDVGNFIVYYDGRPIIIDVGVETYTRKTFSAQRYEIWTMQSGYHNLPTINTTMQAPGREYSARDVSYTSKRSYAQLKLDLSKAYPAEAGLDSWIRTVRLNRNKNVTVADEYRLSKMANELALSLMTPCEITDQEPGGFRLQEKRPAEDSAPVNILVKFKPLNLKLEVTPIALTDGRLKAVWGDQLNRIVLSTDNPPLRDQWTLTITP